MPTRISAQTDISRITDNGGAQGDIFYYNGSNIVALPKGTNGQFLKQGATIPGWATIGEADVTNLVTDLAATEKTANKGVASGYCDLDAGVLVPASRLSHSLLLTVLNTLSAAEIITLLVAPNNTTSFLRGDGTWVNNVAAFSQLDAETINSGTSKNTTQTFTTNKHLEVTIDLEDSGHATELLYLQFNLDTGNNYLWAAMDDNGAINSQSGTVGIRVFSASSAGKKIIKFTIKDDGTSCMVKGEAFKDGMHVASFGGKWSNTGITKITLWDNNSNNLASCTVLVLGNNAV